LCCVLLADNGAGGDATANSVAAPDEPQKLSEEWWAEYVTSEDQFKTELSGKLMMLTEILQMCESIGDKVYVDYFLSVVDTIYHQ